MTNKSLVINGVNFPMEDKQDKHFNIDITGKVVAHYWNMRELPEDKDKLWTEKGFIQIAKVAYHRAQEQGTSYLEALHKTTWWILMNRPSTLVMLTNKLNDEQLGKIKYCLTHNIAVALEDRCSNTKRVIQPVADLYSVDLFKKFKVETIKLEDYPEEKQNQIITKRQLLADARVMYMRPIWEKVNEELQDITDFYNMLKLESIEESRTWADRYRTAEILQAYGANITIYDLDKPELMEAIINELSIWAPAFDISLRLTDIAPTTSTYATRWEITPSHLTRQLELMVNPKDRSIREVLTPAAMHKKMLKIKSKLSKDALHKIIEAYIQVQFYKEHVQEFISDKYYVCKCGKPNHKHHQVCIHCEQDNPHLKVVVPIDKETYNKLWAMGIDYLEQKYDCTIWGNAIVKYLTEPEELSYNSTNEYYDHEEEM